MSSNLLTRKQAAALLRDAGWPMTVKNLGQLSYKETGPNFIKLGHRVMYLPDELLKWARERTWRNSRADPGLDPSIWRDRRDTAKLLQAAGYTYGYGTLSIYASMECGPSYKVIGGKAYYRVTDALTWAAQRWQANAKWRNHRPTTTTTTEAPTKDETPATSE